MARKRGRATSLSSSSSSSSSSTGKRRRVGPPGPPAHGNAPFLFVGVRAARSALAEALEWVGDAVVGELVARVLLAHFHATPLSARVFRSLLLSVVSNRNLALVCDHMGYAAAARDGKEKADVVEAVVGELAVRLMRERRDARGCAQLRSHLDALLAAMLRAHFDARTRARRLGAGPLSVSRNPFACLPEEQLDDVTGELVVLQGALDEVVEQRDDDDAAAAPDKSVADLLDEYDAAGDALVPTGRHHAFAWVSPTADSDDAESVVNGGADTVATANDDDVVARTRAAMQRLGAGHVLRASKDVFEVFKIYGMTVLSERVSLALAQSHLLHPRALEVPTTPTTLGVTPAALGVSSALIFVDRVGGEDDSGDDDARRAADERLRANTLRAFVGFHSAVATTTSAATQRSSALVGDICQFLRAGALDAEPPVGAEHHATRIPDREPLVSLALSLSEAKAFMSSPTCDDLHQPGERPPGAAGAAPSSEFLLRRCDSEDVENLFETLAKEQERETRRALARERADKAQQTKRRKAARATANSSSGAGSSGATAPLAANLARFQHRRFLFCLEEIVVLFAQRKTDECRRRMSSFERELEPCATSACFRKWEVSTSTLTLAMRDSFFRLLLHDVCQFHEVASSSKTTRDGTRVTQLRLPLHYSWAKVARRITTELEATT
ncbi:hypothetical protein PybrP1_011192 [[Pythium] brassicae (nom. inval.)]|nr:hypothetical protein PybrP1_011192 [[Pythium] brassicae (nom. inval.)]